MATSSDDFNELDGEDFLAALDNILDENPRTKSINCFLCKKTVEVNLSWRLKKTCDLCYEKLRRVYLRETGEVERYRFYDNMHGPYTKPWDRMSRPWEGA